MLPYYPALDFEFGGPVCRRIVADSADAILVFDEDGTVLFANREAGTLFQRHPDELVGRSFRAALRQGDRAEWRISEDDGPPTIAEIRLSPTVWEGQPAIMGSFRDITARKRLEESLYAAIHDAEQGNRMKAQFIADLGHEVRTALNAILGFTQFIQTEPHGPVGSEKYREYLGDIHDSGSHLIGLINDLLDLSKAEAGRLVLSEETFEVASVVRGAIRTLRPNAEAARLDIRIDRLDDSLVLHGDPVKMRQVLLNLLSNAIKYTPPGGAVRVSAFVTDTGACVLSIADNGVGMAPEFVTAAFAPYGRAENRFTRKVEGTGIGLALSKRLVELHGGAIRIVSDLGTGTCVTVTLPARRVVRCAAPDRNLAVGA